MEYRSTKGFTGLAQLGFLFAFIGVGVILAGSVQLLFVKQMLPSGAKITDNAAVLKAMTMTQNIGLARASQVVGTLLLLFLPAVMWSIICNGKNILWIGFSKYINGYQIIIAFFIMYAAAAAAAPLADISKNIFVHFPKINAVAKSLEDTYNMQAAALSNLRNVQEYIVALFIMAFFPAMFEEVFFRASLQNLLVRWWQKPMIAIIVTSLLFSLIHWSIYLFLSRALLGFALGLMYYKTKNIWVNIIAHFINNAIALTALFFYQRRTGKVDLEKIDPSMHWSIGLIGIVALIGLFILLTKYSVKNKAAIELEESKLLTP